MRLSRLLLIGLVVLAGASAWWAYHRSSRTGVTLVELLEKPRERRVHATQLRDPPTARPSPVGSPVGSMVGEQGFAPGCVSLWDRLVELDLERARDRIPFEPLPFEPGCVAAPREYGQLQMIYLASCARWIMVDVHESVPISESCLAALFLLRSTWASRHLRDVPLESVNDLPELGDRLAGEFAGLLSGTPEPSRLRAVAERMLEIDPRIYGAAKAAVIAEVISGLRDSALRERPDDGRWESLLELVDRAESLDSRQDPELEVLKRAIETHGFEPQRVREASLRLLDLPELSVPARATALYEYAYAEWKLGRREESLAALRRAIALSPNDPEWRKTEAAVTADGAGPDSFGLSIALAMDFRGLL